MIDGKFDMGRVLLPGSPGTTPSRTSCGRARRISQESDGEVAKQQGNESIRDVALTKRKFGSVGRWNKHK